MPTMYSSLPSDPEKVSSSPSLPEQTRVSLFVQRYRPLAIGIVPIAIAVIGSYFVGRVSVSLEECGRKLSTWSPALDAIEYHQVTWDGRFLAPSVFRGTPNPKLDAAWESIVQGGEGILRVTMADLARFNKSHEADKIIGFQDDTDGVQVILEVFHQLHCLASSLNNPVGSFVVIEGFSNTAMKNMLRKKTWPDHYPKTDPHLEKVARDHLDHCIEMLRIVLMCAADVTPITAHWTSPTHFEPDFSTMHTCRNFDKIRDFARDHAVKWGQ